MKLGAVGFRVIRTASVVVGAKLEVGLGAAGDKTDCFWSRRVAFDMVGLSGV